MAKIISVGIQKGGVSKSSTSSVLAYALSQEHRVLAVDMDGQGNLTQLLTGIDDIFEFDGSTVYDSIMNEDASDYILELTPNLHMLCGDEKINTLCPHFYLELNGNFHYTLKNALEKVADKYDYIILDNPPALGEISVISLTASDYVLVVFEPSNFCYNSLKSYLKTIEAVKENVNEKLELIGILRNMVDSRRVDNKYFLKLIKEEFSEYVLDTVIKRSAEIGRLPSYGVLNNKEMKKVMKIYKPAIKEVLERV